MASYWGVKQTSCDSVALAVTSEDKHTTLELWLTDITASPDDTFCLSATEPILNSDVCSVLPVDKCKFSLGVEWVGVLDSLRSVLDTQEFFNSLEVSSGVFGSLDEDGSLGCELFSVTSKGLLLGKSETFLVFLSLTLGLTDDILESA